MTKQLIGLLITDTHLSENTIEVNFSVFEQSILKCKELGLDKVFHAGDIFTSRKGQTEIVLNAFKAILDMFEEAEIQLVAIPGNHDKTQYISESSILEAFSNNPSFTLFSPYGAIDCGNVIIHLLPYYDEDLSYSEYIKLIQIPLTHKNILITHLAVNGVKNNSGVVIGNEINSNLFTNFDVVFVGHYHDRQIFDNIVYTGSTHQANFGEDDNKGYTLIYDDCSYEFGTFATPSYKTIEIEEKDIDNKLMKLVKSNAENKDKIRLKICGDKLETKTPFILELQQLGVKVERVKEDYIPSDSIQAETVQITSNDILLTYKEWATDRNIEDSNYGLKLLEKAI